MKSLAYRFLAAASVIGFLAHTPDARGIDPVPANPTAEIQEIRKEMTALRLRLEQLENRRAASIPQHPAPDSGEKARLQTEALQIVAHYRGSKSTAWRETHARIRDLRREVTAALEAMQADYTRKARLDEALAIRDAIRCLPLIGRKVQSDPGRLHSVGAVSEVLYFRVTGSNSGSVYGTGVYTSDSNLATAAVHAGILKQGQTGVIKVTTLPNHPQFVGSTQNGITTSSWSSYPGYRVEALDDEDGDLADNEPVAGDTTIKSTPPACDSPKIGTAIDAPFAPSRKGDIQPKEPVVTWPAALPPEAREQLEGHLAMVGELRQKTREKVAGLAAEAVSQLNPIQDAHTRAARLDEAIAVRDLIRQLAP